MDSDSITVLQNLLHQPETVYCVLEVNNLSSLNVFDAKRVLALVKSELAPSQIAIFVFKTGNGTVLLDCIIPIHQDFEIKKDSNKNEYLEKQSCLVDASGDEIDSIYDDVDDDQTVMSPIHRLHIALYNSPGELVVEATNVALQDKFLEEVIAASEISKEKQFIEGESHDWINSYHLSADLSSSQNLVDSEITKDVEEDEDETLRELAEVSRMLQRRKVEFTDPRNITLFCGTWNVNGKVPEPDLSKYICHDKESPDIYVLGFQELDLSAEAFLINGSTKEEDWDTGIFTLLPNHKKIKSKQLVGMLIMVYVKNELVKHIYDVQAEACGCGILGVMGNKGGVAVRFRIYNTTICFVNSHLAADQELVDKRNFDYAEICKRMIFSPPIPSVSREKTFSKKITIFDHDLVFWIGDLNYRIALDNEEGKRLCELEDWSTLIKYDQLTIERKNGHVYQNFNEGPLLFKPSYKYDPGTHIFDTSEKQRTPSWCDRVLWLGSGVEQHRYHSHPDLLCSDHKPVSALFTIKALEIDDKRQDEVYVSIMRDRDRLQNGAMPDAQLNHNSLNFQDVQYLVTSSKTLELENTGYVPVSFSFLKKTTVQNEIHKKWLSIAPSFGEIRPGRKTVIRFTVKVDNESVSDFSKSTELSDLLVIHLEKGKDIFVEVNGNFMPTPFGRSLNDLVCEPCAIRAPLAVRERASKDSSKLFIPRELWELVNYIFLHAMSTPGIFLTEGNHHEIVYLCECLATGTSLKSFHGSVHSVARSVLLFLEVLGEPVIPFNLSKAAKEAAHSLATAKQVLAQLPAINHNVFIYIISLGRELLKYKHLNELSAEKLAVVLGTALLGREKNNDGPKQSQNSKRCKWTFVYNFLIEL